MMEPKKRGAVATLLSREIVPQERRMVPNPHVSLKVKSGGNNEDLAISERRKLKRSCESNCAGADCDRQQTVPLKRRYLTRAGTTIESRVSLSVRT